ncbi:MAG TPA: alpha-amylase family glycosyl hydrolase, partial [Thermoanaerobaculia bacterium]
GLPDFRTELPQVADYLMDAHLGLAARTGLDGFRLDTVKHVSHEFWRGHRERVRTELSDDFFLLGEVWGGDAQVLDPWFAGDEIDAGFDFGFAGSTLAFLQGRGRAVAFEHYLETRQAARTGYLLAHYLSSHDVPTALALLGGDPDLFRLAAVLQLTVRGIPVVYYGEEVGRLGGEWPENRSDMPWGDRPVPPGAGLPRDEDLRRDYRRLIALRRAHPALWRGEHSGLSTEGDLLVFLRLDRESGDAVVVAVNRGAEPASARLAVPEPWAGRPEVRDAWGGGTVPVAGGAIELAVPPRDARILVADDGGEED